MVMLDIHLLLRCAIVSCQTLLEHETSSAISKLVLTLVLVMSLHKNAIAMKMCHDFLHCF